mmetsp:Transcript_3033/g.11650  ORF Transcript_3033/g.11650 Transcript_3033/m.11650 type:complete len:262 (-) Transcript_3033:713-1498(-)
MRQGIVLSHLLVEHQMKRGVQLAQPSSPGQILHLLRENHHVMQAALEVLGQRDDAAIVVSTLGTEVCVLVQGGTKGVRLSLLPRNTLAGVVRDDVHYRKDKEMGQRTDNEMIRGGAARGCCAFAAGYKEILLGGDVDGCMAVLRSGHAVAHAEKHEPAEMLLPTSTVAHHGDTAYVVVLLRDAWKNDWELIHGRGSGRNQMYCHCSWWYTPRGMMHWKKRSWLLPKWFSASSSDEELRPLFGLASLAPSFSWVCKYTLVLW